MNAHKITVNKSDEATLIAEKIIDVNAKDILLAVPRFSRLSESSMNFRLLKREAETLGKRIVVESVDEKVVELCKANSIECVNPFFSDGQRQFSDIVTGKTKKKEESKKSVQAQFVAEEPAPKPSVRRFRPGNLIARPLSLIFGARRMVGLAGVLLIVALGLFLGLSVLPKADIKIKAARTNWLRTEALVVDKALAALDPAAAKIPGQVFTDRKNLQLFFPASGKKQVEQKAKGTITIWNNGSSAPQSLVATTRFAAPDGKIFRLVQKITVPGAKLVDGKVQPASIDAAVIADKAGPAYNIGPTDKFTIPGFAGTPKFEIFYGVSKDSMKGGFVGEAAYPSPDDLKKAKADSAAALEDSMKGIMIAQLPKDFKLIAGAEKFKLLSQKVNSEVGEDGKFSVLVEGEFAMTVFREDDVLALFGERIKSEIGPDFEVKSHEIKYVSPRLTSGNQLSFSVDYSAVLAKRISEETLKQKIAGKSENDLKAEIFAVSGIESAQVSLWPFWVMSVPTNTDKITVSVD